MTRKQVAFIIGVNALISTIISVVVVLLVARPVQVKSTPTPTAGVTTAVAVAPVTPTPGPITHIVEAGDTISGLAFQYDVPEADIIAANQLDNPNFLTLGTELIIPVGGLPDATATFTPAPTATDTPLPELPPAVETATAEAGPLVTDTPLPLPAAGELNIVITEVIGAGQVEQERVVIANNGDRLADMAGWTLNDADGNSFPFPNFRLWAGGNVTVHTRVGEDGNPPANFYWQKLVAIWTPGETVTLRNALGEEMATFVVGP